MKTAILITARLKSTRLPKKAIKPIEGKPMIRHQIDRLRLAERPEQIIMCTSPVDEDDPLERIAEDEGISCYRGDPEDVLLRLANAAQKFNVDIVVNATADNPLTDPKYIDKLVQFHRYGKYDYSEIKGLPHGAHSYAFSRAAAERAIEIKTKRDTEVWGGYFTETGVFKTGQLEVENKVLRRPELRLTVDTSEDFELVKKIFGSLYEEERVFSLNEVIQLLNQKSYLTSVNEKVTQKEPEPIEVEEPIELS